MIFLGLEKINDEKALVGLTHYFPEQLTDDEKTRGILVEEIPTSENIDNKMPVLYYNYSDSSLYYEYKEAPKSLEQQNAEKIDLMQKALDDLLLGGV